ncbi:MAG: DUF5791 family protein [Salinirussus sp.]
MIRGEFPAAGEQDPDTLRAAYDDLLATTISSVGREAVAADTEIDDGRLGAIIEGESPELSLTEAATILATDPDRPDADTVAAEARDVLLMGMTTAVLDVEALASGIEDALEPKEIQAKVEGRHPMSLDEYALLHAYVAGSR